MFVTVTIIWDFSMITLPLMKTFSHVCCGRLHTLVHTTSAVSVWGQFLILLKTKSDSESRVSEGTAGSSNEKTGHIFLGPKYFALFYMNFSCPKHDSFLILFFISSFQSKLV